MALLSGRSTGARSSSWRVVSRYAATLVGEARGAMARPLTKHDRSGNRYTRPVEIEAAVGVALAQDLPTLCRRAALHDRNASEFLPSECLVHLVRDARRSGHEATINQLLPFLLERCMANLIAKLPDGAGPNAHDVREEVLGQLAEL